jgi:hypothetical protein
MAAKKTDWQTRRAMVNYALFKKLNGGKVDVCHRCMLHALEERTKAMRKAALILGVSGLLIVFINGWGKTLQKVDSATPSAEQEIRSALCDLEKRDFVNAQRKIDTILKSDPENIYAQKFSLGILVKQIKLGDTSAENLALVRKAIEAYSGARKNPRFTEEERAGIDRLVIILYRQLGEEETNAELTRRGLDKSRTAKERAEIYAILAGKSWDCAYRITSTKKVLQKSEIEKVEKCVAFGKEYVDLAIRLDAENENAWNYKALLLSESAKLYGLKNDQAAKAFLQRQSDAAKRRAAELANATRAAEEKERARQTNEEQKTNPVKDVAEAQTELTDYREQNSLDQIVQNLFLSADLELSSLMAPVPMSGKKTDSSAKPRKTTETADRGCFRESDGPAQVLEKREWKSFTDGEITVDLPDNVCPNDSGDAVAATEGAMFTLQALRSPSVSAEPTVADGVLNTMARTFVSFRSRSWLSDGPGNSFEIKLLRKEDSNHRLRKIYSYSLMNCSGRKNGVLIVQTGTAHYYLIDINGADESDARTQRVLKSLTFE